MSRGPRPVTWLKIVISLGLVALLVSRIDLRAVGTALGHADPPLLIAAIVLGHLDRLLQAAKWRSLLVSSGVPIGLGAAVENTYVGNFAGMFLPSGVGGDVVRVWLLKRMRLPVDEVVASILVERGFGVLALVATAGWATVVASLVGVTLPPELPGAIAIATVGALAVALASFRLGVDGLLAFVDRIGARFGVGAVAHRMLAAYRRYGKRKRVLLRYSALSMIEVMAIAGVYVLVTRSLHEAVGILPLLAVVPVILFLQRLPVSIHGIGVSEGALTWFLVRLGLPASTALAVAVAGRLVEATILLPGGILWMRNRRASAGEAPQSGTAAPGDPEAELATAAATEEARPPA